MGCPADASEGVGPCTGPRIGLCEGSSSTAASSGWSWAGFLKVGHCEHAADELHGEPDDIRCAPPNQTEGESLVLKAASPCFSTPESAGEIPIEERIVEKAHFQSALVGRFEGWGVEVVPEADPGHHPVMLA